MEEISRRNTDIIRDGNGCYEYYKYLTIWLFDQGRFLQAREYLETIFRDYSDAISQDGYYSTKRLEAYRWFLSDQDGTDDFPFPLRDCRIATVRNLLCELYAIKHPQGRHADIAMALIGANARRI